MSAQKVICDVCGEEVKNFGAHKYQKHKDVPGTIIPVDSIVVDVPKEKPLSDLVLEMKKLLRPYRFTIKVIYEEEDVNIMNMEIIARIHYRR